jgi:hypothetical protein
LYGAFFVGLYMLWTIQKQHSFWSIKHMVCFGVKHIDYMLLPFLFYGLTSTFLKPYGNFAGYNALNHIPTLRQWVHAFERSLFYSLYRHVAVGLWVMSVAVIISEAVYIFRQKAQVIQVYRRLGLILFGMGLLALVLALFPYILVGKAPDSNFIFLSRSAILMPLGVALCFSGVCCRYWLKSSGKLNKLGLVLVSILLLNCLYTWTHWYLRLSSQSALQKAFVGQLKQHPDWGDQYSIFWFRVYFPRKNHPVYADYAWAGLLNIAYGGQSHYIHHVNVNGCQAVVTIKPGKYGVNYTYIGLLHLYYRLIHPSMLSYFYQHLLNVVAQPYYSRAALDCPAPLLLRRIS